MSSPNSPRSFERWKSVAKEKNVHELALLASSLPRDERAQLLTSVEDGLRCRDVHFRERTRVAFAKLLIAIMPDSWTTIRTLVVSPKRGRLDAEMRFSLFCYFDELPRIIADEGLVSEAAFLVGEYLLHAKSNAAHAMWMAGDLLGDHWDPADGVPILIDVLANARYAEGRLAALHGLEHALAKNYGSDEPGRSIVCAITQVSREDRSRKVRDSARRILEGVSACVSQGGRVPHAAALHGWITKAGSTRPTRSRHSPRTSGR